MNEPLQIGGETAYERNRSYRLFVVAGEHSGDALGAKLMAALNAQWKGRVRYLGVGGEQMAKEGLVSQFPTRRRGGDGPARDPQAPAAHHPPRLRDRRRGHRRRTRRRRHHRQPGVHASDRQAHPPPPPGHPDHRLRVAERVGVAAGPGEAKMRAYIDHVLALLPFEPEAHQRLGGPPCTYVGHPLIERLDWMHGLDPHPLADRAGSSTPRAPFSSCCPAAEPRKSRA